MRLRDRVVLKSLQRQVSLFLTVSLTVLNGKDMASSYVFQKGQYQHVLNAGRVDQSWFPHWTVQYPK